MWPLLALGGQIGSSLLGGFMGSDAAEDSQAAMAAAIKKAAADRDRGFKNALGSYKTGYEDAGENIAEGYDAALESLGPQRWDATDQIYDDLGAGDGGFDTYQQGLRDSFESSPGYDFRMREGEKALANQYNARGLTRSGAYDKALVDYAQGRASDEFSRHTGNYQDYLSRMAGLAGREDQLAGQRAGYQVGRGNALGALDWDYGRLKGGTQIDRADARAEASYGQGMNTANGITSKANAWTNALGNIGQAFGSFAGNMQGQSTPWKY
jgi:hypothetical protein